MHPEHLPREARDALWWVVAVAAGLALTALLVALHLRVGTSAAPFTGHYRVKVGPGSVLAPGVAAAVLLATARGWTDRLPWGVLLAAAWAAALAWAVSLALVDGGNGLAGPVASAHEYLRDVGAVHGDPAGFLRHFVAGSGGFSPATRQHPPAPVLLLWAARPLGLVRPETIGLAVTAVGSLTPPLVAASVRPLCGEVAARRLLPLLVLAPWAVWTAVSMDAVTAAVCAAFIALGVKSAQRGTAPSWALLAGLLLGLAALLSYSAGWLAATLIATYFLRRRPLLNLLTGAGALVPLGLFRAAGFVWPDGLTAAQRDFSLRVGPHRSWLVWVPLSLLLLAIACGPALVPAIRKVRNTPGWPFLAGAVLAVGFALGSGLSRGEVERSWLPFFPWLLVPAVAPEQPGGEAPGAPLWLGVLGAVTGVVVEAVVASPW